MTILFVSAYDNHSSIKNMGTNDIIFLLFPVYLSYKKMLSFVYISVFPLFCFLWSIIPNGSSRMWSWSFVFLSASPVSLRTGSDSEVLARIKLLEGNVTILQLGLVRTCVRMLFFKPRVAQGLHQRPVPLLSRVQQRYHELAITCFNGWICPL